MNVMLSGIDGAVCYSSLPLSVPVIPDPPAAASERGCVKSRRILWLFLLYV
jgi:hypothetical protein